MDDPESEIPKVIQNLTLSPPAVQHQTLLKFFTPDASFTHPFCAVPSLPSNPYIPTSRYLISKIYTWYKILSPQISLQILSVAFDKQNLLLYVTIHQVFAIWFIPFYRAPVTLTTVLQLTTTPGNGGAITDNFPELNIRDPNLMLGSYLDLQADVKRDNTTKYWIKSQNDLYQTSEFVKFVMPFGIGVLAVTAFQYFATVQCLVGALLLWWVTGMHERVFGKGKQEAIADEKKSTLTKAEVDWMAEGRKGKQPS
ncbi:MAG: hypothetical protein Q9227_009385 [Pyrenula ochraceoflavens]